MPGPPDSTADSATDSPTGNASHSAARTVAVDLRALVPAATGIGVYNRSLLAASAARGTYRYHGLAHRDLHDPAELAGFVSPLETGSRWPLGVLWQQLELPGRLLSLAAQGAADLFWSPLMTLPSIPAVLSHLSISNLALPSVVTVYDLTTLLFPETHTVKVRWSVLPFLEKSLAHARRVMTISQATARDLAFHFPEHAAKVRVVTCGVDPSFRPGAPDDIAATRRDLEAPEGYILYVGALEPRKNVGALLSAWSACKADDPDFPPLVLAGDDGWRNRSLRRRIQGLAPHGVHHLGRVSQDRLLRLYQGARLFAYPSLYEGFGLPPLEAMACGVPVIVTDVSSLPEVVGDAGLKVPVNNVPALIQALQRLTDDPAMASDFAHRARERAARFTWTRAAADLDAVFDEALD